MSHIRILPEILSNKIAAGEVVERPSSVVKELIENAIDAKSTRILIDVEQGGASLIQVSDNGMGMNRDDALLSIERYATSKVYNETDLFCIRTLGFRGEALPSIASVSQFVLSTKDTDSQVGTELIIHGGKLRDVRDIGIPVGTMVSVKNLFYNTPVRKKFMKTALTEMGHIADMITRIAMVWHGIQFKFSHNGKLVKMWNQTADRRERVLDVLGNDLDIELLEMNFQSDRLSLQGWISSPNVKRTTAQKIYVYVNGRSVRDMRIRYALIDGYKGKLVKGEYPSAALLLQIPYDQVDVNVHPSKNEVRFVDEKYIYHCVKTSVEKVLMSSDKPTWPKGENKPVQAEIQSKPFISPPVYHQPIPKIAENIKLNDIHSKLPIQNTHDQQDKFQDKPHVVQSEMWDNHFFEGLEIIGQLHHSYMVCGSKNGMVLIDQHAAHERVLFEQIQKIFHHSTIAVQPLIFPETIDLTYEESCILEVNLNYFKQLGLEIEPFGGRTFVIKAVPEIMFHVDPKSLIRSMVERMMETGRESDALLDNLIATMACHGAVKANQPLRNDQLKTLLSQLDQCKQPSRCPHGRPLWIYWDITAIEKMFKR
ncbi:MAG: DNA mismatch repair endonuclease MutL [Desulfobacterales bacterium]|nr:DNA mismatch repair endonuclease MutL [Desulfobacterales bacterium]